jgi:hypothetical protein
MAALEHRALTLKAGLLLLTVSLLLGACATVPPGPSVMVLPGSGRSFPQFQNDDAICREWALRQTGTTPGRAAAGSGIATAAIATGVGAASGAAIGAAVGQPAAGAAIGAGSGLLVGSSAGAARGDWAGASAQSRYDNSYLQCMYANGNQIPVAAGSVRPYSPWSAYTPPRRSVPWYVPPPPAGLPPPPPPR